MEQSAKIYTAPTGKKYHVDRACLEHFTKNITPREPCLLCVGKLDKLAVEADASMQAGKPRTRETTDGSGRVEKTIDCSFCSDTFWTKTETELRMIEILDGDRPPMPHTLYETYYILKTQIEEEDDAKEYANIQKLERNRLLREAAERRPSAPVPEPDPEVTYISPGVVPARSLNLNAPQPNAEQAMRRRQFFKRNG